MNLRASSNSNISSVYNVIKAVITLALWVIKWPARPHADQISSHLFPKASSIAHGMDRHREHTCMYVVPIPPII